MAAKVLQELDQLRSMLRPDSASYMPAPFDHGSGESSMRPYVGCSTSSTTEKSVDRLGRAIEAAEEEVEAAMRRTTDIHKSQLRQKELEVAELQRLLSSTRQTADGLRQSLTATKRSYEQKLQHLEASLQLRDDELATLRAELLALQADRDSLTLRCQQDLSTISRLEAELVKHTEEFSSSLQAERGAAAQAAAAAQRERQDKELLVLEGAELRRELESLEADLAAARSEASCAASRAEAEQDRRCELEVLLDKAAAATDIIRETKDLEIAELRRKVKAEHGVRKACERWLRSELQSREEMEGLLLAVRAMALGPGPPGALTPAATSAAAAAATTAEISQVEALLAQLEVAGGGQQEEEAEQQRSKSLHCQKQQGPQGPHVETSSSSGEAAAGRLLASEAAANQYRKEFAQMKAMLGEDSKRLRHELESAKQLLKSKVQQ